MTPYLCECGHGPEDHAGAAHGGMCVAKTGMEWGFSTYCECKAFENNRPNEG
jgi:hypothetical protein